MVEVAQRLAQLGDPLDALHARRPGAGAEAPVQARARGCLTRLRRCSRRRLGAQRARGRDRAGPGRAARSRVLEGAETLGGGCRSEELTLPGFVHDTCSTVHALALASPFLRSLPLAEHGLELVHPAAPLAHPLDDGSAVMLERSVEATAAAPRAATRVPTGACSSPLVARRRRADAARCSARFARRATRSRWPASGRGAPLRSGPRPIALRGRARAGALRRLLRALDAVAASARQRRVRHGARAQRPPGRLAGRRAAARSGWPTRSPPTCARSAARIETGRRVESLDELDGARRRRSLDVTPRQLLRAGRRPAARPATGDGSAATATGPASSSSTGRSTGRSRGRAPEVARAGRCTSAARSRRSPPRRRPRPTAEHPRPAVRPARAAEPLRPLPRPRGQAHGLGLLPRPARLDAGHDRRRSRRRSSASPRASAT